MIGARWRRPRLLVPSELEECGFGVIDWRALPSPVAIELLRAADRIARDGHAVAFTGRPYRTGPELTVDRRPTVVRYLSGQPAPEATPETASQLLIAALDGLVSSARHIAVVSGQPELSKQDAAQAVTDGRPPWASAASAPPSTSTATTGPSTRDRSETRLRRPGNCRNHWPGFGAGRTN